MRIQTAPDVFYEVKSFKEEEFADWEGMDPLLIYWLDEFRNYVNHPIKILESNTAWHPGTLHREGSLHFEGRALDCACSSLSLFDFFLAASRFAFFTGIGVYPYWNTPGLHLDNGTGIPRRYWWRDNEGQYKGISVYNVKEVFGLEAQLPLDLTNVPW